MDIIEQFSSDPTGKTIIYMNPPLMVIPVWEDAFGIFTFIDYDLDIDVFTIEEKNLCREVRYELGFLWRNYAMAADEDLDKNEIKLKQALLSRCSLREPT